MSATSALSNIQARRISRDKQHHSIAGSMFSKTCRRPPDEILNKEIRVTRGGGNRTRRGKQTSSIDGMFMTENANTSHPPAIYEERVTRRLVLLGPIEQGNDAQLQELVRKFSGANQQLLLEHAKHEKSVSVQKSQPFPNEKHQVVVKAGAPTPPVVAGGNCIKLRLKCNTALFRPPDTIHKDDRAEGGSKNRTRGVESASFNDGIVKTENATLRRPSAIYEEEQVTRRFIVRGSIEHGAQNGELVRKLRRFKRQLLLDRVTHRETTSAFEPTTPLLDDKHKVTTTNPSGRTPIVTSISDTKARSNWRTTALSCDLRPLDMLTSTSRLTVQSRPSVPRPPEAGRHAGPGEPSLVVAVRPDLVQLEGVVEGEASYSTAEAGESLYQSRAVVVARALRAIKNDTEALRLQNIFFRCSAAATRTPRASA